jgi:trk system potassium uptake protein
VRFIIVGCGRDGAGLAQALDQRGHVVTVIDRDPAAFERLAPSFKGHTISGVGFDRDVLIKAGVEHADGLAATTNSDEANVVTTRVARQTFRVPRVVARLYDPRKAEIYRRLGIQSVTPSTWAIHRIAELLSYTHLDVVLSLGSGEVEVIMAEVPHMLAGRNASELTIPGEAQVVAVNRGGRTFLATLGTVFREGDQVYLAVQAASTERVKSLLALG